jgi:hypothetical protein
MQFLYQPLTWGFLLVLLPLLIHLINLTRQRKVQWAAMEFLLAAHKKHRKWIWLRQFLLLASRMLIIALAVAMLAHLVTRSQWAQILGGSTTHHIVLLDDSFSMSDQVGNVTPFQKAESVIRRLADRIDAHEWGQKLTLIRLSQAARLVPAEAQRDPLAAATQVADLYGITVDGEFEKRIENLQNRLDVSALACHPTHALELLSELIGTFDQERPIVYLVSDFRSETWDQGAELIELVREIEKKGARVNFVRCAQQQHNNLAITGLRPTAGTRAAGVPLFVEISVTNFGTSAAERVPVSIQSTLFRGDSSSDDPATDAGTANELPSILLDSIEPGQTVTRRVQVYFPTAGYHVVAAELPADGVLLDNRRWSVVDFPADIPVAVIDGDPARQNATFLTSVFRPSQRVQTGLRPEEKTPSFLRDASEQQLDEYHVIYLLDVPSLDAMAMANLAAYVRRGGGVAIFLGPHTNLEFYRRWYNEGEGLFPLPLHRIAFHSPVVDSTPSLVVENHPIFRVLLGEGNPFANQVRIQQYAQPEPNWQPQDQSTTQVLARLGDGSPLAVERSFGDGRVVTFLTTLAPIWNFWAMQPSFVVVLLELQVYLDGFSLPHDARLVGTPINVDVDTTRTQREVTFVVPDTKGGRQMLRRQSQPINAGDPSMQRATLGVDIRERLVGRTDRPGIYEAWERGIAGELDVKRFALNVDTRESNLALTPPETLADAFSATNVRLLSADELTLGDDPDEGAAWSQYLFWAVLVMLLLEQMLGFWTSYHPTGKGATGKGAIA